MARPRMLRSLRTRITAGALIVVALVLGLGAVATVQLLERSLTEGVEVALEQDLDRIGDRMGGRDPRIDDIDDDVLVRVDGPRPTVNDEDADRLPRVPEGEPHRVTVDGEEYLAASEDADGDRRLTVARSLEHVRDAVGTATGLLVVAVPLVLALIGVVVWTVTSRALAPVERLRRQVDEIDATGLHRRVDAGGDDELGSLALTMNRMLDRIEQSQITQRRFVSDASHELRSPLATIRQHAELAATHPESMTVEMLSRVVREEGARMQDLVEGLLLLARLDERRPGPGEPVDLDDLALAEVRRLRGMGVAVDGRGIGPGRVNGSPTLLARALRNLVDNAARHAASLVSVRVWTDAGHVHLQVEDDGAGIPEAEREHVFDRFTRLDEARARDAGGSGLGLAIVREIAAAHHGTVGVDAGPAGGARFTLSLPAGS
ncbi:sensor histidine kinase [Microbacterium sp.]|uniref:sensor histidine kinase n=1 Tax=Microbacterium sp. TaxID=51671 RepID=UPI002812743D|nr:HAMP domain-containing sensor histidine kinase [Microbacterium sp.]